MIHRLGFWLELHFPRIWAATYARYYCPRPIIDDKTARACIDAGQCGCDNAKPSPQAIVNTERRLKKLESLGFKDAADFARNPNGGMQDGDV